MTLNGKLDRKALPKPDSGAYSLEVFEAPAGEFESALAAVWAETLDHPRVGRYDNFFALGGDSLVAVRVVTKLRQVLGIDASLRHLFTHPVLADFSHSLKDSTKSHLVRISRVERTLHLPCSYAQQRLWFLSQVKNASRAYHIPTALLLKGPLRVDSLHNSLSRIIERHESLRTVFTISEGKPVQVIRPATDLPFSLQTHDLRVSSDKHRKLENFQELETSRAFDLSNGPLIRGCLIQLGDDQHVLLITMHHIVSDGWSMGVFIRELTSLYTTAISGGLSPLPDLDIQYVDYAVWQRRWIEGQVLGEQLLFWTQALEGAPPLLDIPKDHPRPPEFTFEGANYQFVLEHRLATGLRNLCRRFSTTVFMTLLTAWAVLLFRLSGNEDIVIGTPVANRGRDEIEGLIGFFANTLALRFDLTGSPSVADLLQQVKERTVGGQLHQDVPFERVVEALNPTRSMAYAPIFQVMFVWQQANQQLISLPELTVTPLATLSATAKVDLILTMEEDGGSIRGSIEYSTDLFERSTIERYGKYLQTILEAIVTDPSQSVRRLPVLDLTERHEMLQTVGLNLDTSESCCIHELFSVQASRCPSAIAVCCQGEVITYGELEIRANRLAHYLRGIGVGPDSRVAVCLDRSTDMVVALLAVLKAGGGYVPLDPDYPKERLQFIIEDALPTALLSCVELTRSRFDFRPGMQLVDLTKDLHLWQSLPESAPRFSSGEFTANCLAYVIYTSGSTGKPKGVMVEHRHVTRLFHSTDQWFHFSQDDVWTLFHSYAFDFSVWEIWGALLYGGRLLIVPKEVTRSPDDFYDLICREKVTVLNQTPSAFRGFIAAQKGNGKTHALRYVIFGGEALEPATLKPWYDLNREDQPQLINMYGITETTVHVTYRPITRADVENILVGRIGRPIPDLSVYILDEFGEPVPYGVIGELYVSGAGVARGYLNRPKLTEERFLPDPFSNLPNNRMYRTGDLGRRLVDGDIEFVGRNDSQVKIRGFRIELNEVRARLLDHPHVRDAVVMPFTDPAAEPTLVAYYVGSGRFSGAAELREHLAALLPEHMVPSAYVQMDSIPLTPNGKLDSAKLPAPGIEAYATVDFEPPLGNTEAQLARLWQEILGVERVGRRDNFFALGGHSILAIALIDRMRNAGFHTEVSLLFRTPTLANLAANVQIGSDLRTIPENLITKDHLQITPDLLSLVKLTQEEIDLIIDQVPRGVSNIQDIYPLSPSQTGILFHSISARGNDPYLLSELAECDTREHLDDFLAAFRFVVQRHDILRTSIHWEKLSKPIQAVWREAELILEELPLGVRAPDTPEVFSPQHSLHDFQIRLDRAPLLRIFAGFDQVRRKWLLMTVWHHLIGDHATLECIQAEVAAFLEKKQDVLAAPAPYRDFVADSIRESESLDNEAFFRRMLSDVDEPTLPFGLNTQWSDTVSVEEHRSLIDSQLSVRLRKCGRDLGITAASIFHLAWARVLAAVSGRSDVIFGTVLFGRSRVTSSGKGVGLFINTLPIRIHADNVGVAIAAHRTHLLLADLMKHEHTPLAKAQRWSDVPAPSPLFTALLNYRHDRSGPSKSNFQWTGYRRLTSHERTSYPFALSVDDNGEHFSLESQAPESIGAQRLCDLVAIALEDLTHSLETDPFKPVQDLRVLPNYERKRLLREWNDTERVYPRISYLQSLFELQAAQTPDAIAVVYEDEALTYSTLNNYSNQLAHHLRELGVVPGSRVGVCMERSAELVVSLLAVLKAGAAYVPLDPEYPIERLRLMTKDSSPRAILTAGSLNHAVPEIPSTAFRVNLDLLNWNFRDYPHTNLDPIHSGLTSEDIAYVIYTSGSTGTPKGVMVPHKGIVNRIQWMQDEYALTPNGSVLQKTPYSFDVSVWEFFWPLSVGARLVVAKPLGHKDPAYLVDLIRRHEITTIHFVPSMLQLFLEHPDSNSLDSLRRVFCSGEALPASTVQRFRERLPLAGLHNLYGPTEASVDVTYWNCPQEFNGPRVPIGKPVANTQIYILDAHNQPVPIGAIGELYIGGVQVASGYLNQPELTSERFLRDPFSAMPCRMMYRSGDLARHLPDGSIEFLGRTDFQIKLRGFRVEPGEIEATLRSIPEIRDAAVLVRGASVKGQQLVAYFTSQPPQGGRAKATGEMLRAQLAAFLPEYMVPAAYVELAEFPLTSSGKLNRKALPDPDREAFMATTYQEPQGEIERTIAMAWAAVLGIEKISRKDNFFALGGHSLSALSLIETLRRDGIELEMRTLFGTPTLIDLALTATTNAPTLQIPPNVIPIDCDHLTPQMLPLVDLSQEEIDHLTATVPGGAPNVQDVYPLAPLQEGILFHHLMGKRDPYLLASLSSLSTREQLEGVLSALEVIVRRHDILRTAIVWEEVTQPVQVVLRFVTVPILNVALDASDAKAEDLLFEQFKQGIFKIDIRSAPMLRVITAFDAERNRWLMLTVWHHLIGDHATLDLIREEIQKCVTGQAHLLESPTPFRDIVALTRSGITHQENEVFFRSMLGNVAEPTAPFGLIDTLEDGQAIDEFRHPVAPDLALDIRAIAREMSVTPATLFHLAWALVLSRASGRDDVVFGTVVFGRMQGGVGASRGIGLFINTLPLRIQLEGHSVASAVQQVHMHLADLMRHEHASLALAQRCSSVAAPTPLFSALLNFRHSLGSQSEASQLSGLVELRGEARTNYPLTLSVDDRGDGFSLQVQTIPLIGSARVCDYVHSSLEVLAQALKQKPEATVISLDIMPLKEQDIILTQWNETERPLPQNLCVHHLFETQVNNSPLAIAAVLGDQCLTYSELNRWSNQIAHRLLEVGAGPEKTVAICLQPTFELLASLLGVLKAGATFLPLDPNYPVERLRFMLEDSKPIACISRPHLFELLGGRDAICIDPSDESLKVELGTNPGFDGGPSALRNLAYVIYTSGSTGRPKGVLVEHLGLTNLVQWYAREFALSRESEVLIVTSTSFDLTYKNLFAPLSVGGRVLLLGDSFNLASVLRILTHHRGILVNLTPTVFFALAEAADQAQLSALETVVFGGEPIPGARLLSIGESLPTLANTYGPTECTGISTLHRFQIQDDAASRPISIGRPLANVKVYILDNHRRPAPIGVVGELYIGGVGVARGYQNLPSQTGERFLHNPFDGSDDRIYRTGDLARWMDAGTIEILGRNDFQVKIRGFRIELGEIENVLLELPGLSGVAVVAKERVDSDKYLVCYYSTDSALPIDPAQLQSHLADRLPEYMVPSVFKRVNVMPLTPSGKLDRKALLEIETPLHTPDTYEPPSSDIELKLAEIWAEILGRDKIGRFDNFFALGGHSLMAIRMITRIRRELGMDVTLRDFFAHPVLAELPAALTVAAPSSTTSIPRIARTRRRIPDIEVPLSTSVTTFESATNATDLQVGKVLD
jgi:amino acid adenylation domain-containing protein